MSSVDYLLDHYRKLAGVSDEQMQQDLKVAGEQSPVAVLEKKVDTDLTNLDERTKGMQDIDTFTLDKTFLIDDRTEGMKEIDDYTLNLVFDLILRIDLLEQKVAYLEGGATNV